MLENDENKPKLALTNFLCASYWENECKLKIGIHILSIREELNLQFYL